MKKIVNFLKKRKDIFLTKRYENLRNDLQYNINLLRKLRFDIEKNRYNLKKNQLNFNDEKLSWHYHIFSNFFNRKRNNILEIGTFKGEFTNYLLSNFPNSTIYTIDLPINNIFFRSTYRRDSDINLKEYLSIRKKNLNKKNIKFIEQSSFNLLKIFKDIKFDLIWIDGDHIMPQVSFDIFQSIYLIKKNGYIFTDDIIQEEINHPYGSTDSFNILENLSQKKIIKSNYLLKRIYRKNAVQKKFISISSFF